METLTDDAIERQVEQAIGLDPRVGVFDVNIQVLRGVARLEGIVESLEAKRAAGEAAARVPGVRRVDNMLTVEDPRGLKSLDIEHAVENALENDPAVDPRDVGARVEDSVAHLVGHVDSTAGGGRRRARGQPGRRGEGDRQRAGHLPRTRHRLDRPEEPGGGRAVYRRRPDPTPSMWRSKPTGASC